MIIILSLLTLPIKVSVGGHVDLFDNDGFFVVRLFGLKVFKGNIHFESEDITHNNLVIESGKKKNEIHLNIDENDKLSIVSMLNIPALQNLKINKLDLDVSVGKNNDAFFTTMLLCSVRLAVYAVLSFIKSRQRVNINEFFTPEYNADKFESDFYAEVSITIGDVIGGLLMSLFKKTNRKKEVLQN